jgi:hypothetical protein
MVWVFHDLVENTPESDDGTVAAQVREPVRSTAAQVGVQVGADNKGFDLRHYFLCIGRASNLDGGVCPARHWVPEVRPGVLGERRSKSGPQLVGQAGVGEPPSPARDRTVRVTDVQQVGGQRPADMGIGDQRAMCHDGAGVELDQGSQSTCGTTTPTTGARRQPPVTGMTSSACCTRQPSARRRPTGSRSPRSWSRCLAQPPALVRRGRSSGVADDGCKVSWGRSAMLLPPSGATAAARRR